MAIEPTPNRVNSFITWLCRCDCGNEVVVIGANLKRGNTTRCGRCPRKHGDARKSGNAPEYMTWLGMIQRCTNPRTKNWHRYGGRGIQVCERWLDYRNFIADMGYKPPNHSLDRINNDGNYSPENCRWATERQQKANTCIARLITAHGQTLCASEWSRRTGISISGIRARLKRGWSHHDAVSVPLIPRHKNLANRRYT